VRDHEYAILGGLNRAKIGQTIGVIAGVISAMIVAAILALINVAKWLGVGDSVPPVLLIPIGAGAVYAALYWLFDRHAWKIGTLSRWLKVPDLSGRWICEGRTLSPGSDAYGPSWSAEIMIIQSWDRIRVRLKTAQSASNSVTASLLHDPVDGYRLIYSYRNDPRIGETELASHLGFAELIFAPDLRSADGEYFNGHGRYTYGTMTLVREEG
jgi:hypothetical protein